LSLRRRDRGCPIPPPAPRTATLESCWKCHVSGCARDDPNGHGRWGLSFTTYVAGRGGEGAALDSAGEGRSGTGGEHDVRWCGWYWGGDGGDGTRCDDGGAKVSLARAGGCVAEASIVRPCTRAPTYVGRINAEYRVAVGSCNTVHILCIVTCIFVDICSEACPWCPS
jgi:hypothetical protein